MVFTPDGGCLSVVLFLNCVLRTSSEVITGFVLNTVRNLMFLFISLCDRQTEAVDKKQFIIRMKHKSTFQWWCFSEKQKRSKTV